MNSSDTALKTLPAAPEAPAPKRSRGRGEKPDLMVHLSRAAVLAALLGLWWAAVELGWMHRLYAATPAQTWARFLELVQEGQFWTNMSITLQETLAGWLIGASLGLVSGLVTGRWRRLARIVEPFLTFANAMPKIALAPFFILWFGIGMHSKIVLAAVVVYFIVFVPTQAAVSTVDRDLDLVATTMAATELQKFTLVVLPGIVAPVFGAIRLAAVYSLLAVVMGEFIAAQAGLGQQLITATNQFDMPTAFVALFVLALLAVTINALVGMVETRLLRWKTHSTT